jgi:RluA family pseudouridine synthase
MESDTLFTTCKILYRDSWLLMIEKPSGVLSHPNPGVTKTGRRPRCAFEGSYDTTNRRFDSPGGPVWLMHRLDQDTSGVLLAALDGTSALHCREFFENGAVEKHYLAVVVGHLPLQGTWKDSLAEKRSSGKIRVFVRRGALPNAEMRFRVCATSPSTGLSLLEVQLLTGRTHQIRVQAASRHRPVLGDDIYGDFALNRWARKHSGLRRLFLHANSLTLPHPESGQPLTIVSPLPEDLKVVMEKLDFKSESSS